MPPATLISRFGPTIPAKTGTAGTLVSRRPVGLSFNRLRRYAFAMQYRSSSHALAVPFALLSLAAAAGLGCATEAAVQQPPPQPETSERGAFGDDDVAGPEATTPTAAAQTPTPLRLFFGPQHIVTGTPDRADGFLVDDTGSIVSLWIDGMPVPPGTRRIALPGDFLVPGLHDAHIHVEGVGRYKDEVDLLGVRSPEEARARIAGYLKRHPGVSAVQGRGWDQSLFSPPAFPSASDLAGFDIPVAVRRVDGHALWSNDVALRLAGVDATTAAPSGGEIMRDADHAPTGIFVDAAMSAIRDALPPATPADHERWLRTGLAACADAGLVAVHDMGMSRATFAVLQSLDAQGAVPLRVFVYLDGDDEEAYPLLATAATERVEVRGVKLYADGALGSRGALLLEEYSDRPGHHGLALTDEKRLEERVRRAHSAGAQVAIHAIGDGGIRHAISAIAAVQGPDVQRRHRIEHAQVVAPADFLAFKSLGLIASMQPTHATSDMRWAEARVGAKRIPGAYAWRTMLNNGIPLAFGSDAPVESEEVRRGIYAGITRQDADGAPKGGWRPEQALSEMETLAAFAAGAAHAVGRERSLGVLAPGRLFDATLFATRPMSPAGWLNTPVRATVVAGSVRPVRGSAPAPTPAP